MEYEVPIVPEQSEADTNEKQTSPIGGLIFILIVVAYVAVRIFAIYNNSASKSATGSRNTSRLQEVADICKPYELCADEKLNIAQVIEGAKTRTYPDALTDYQKWAIALGGMTIQLNNMPHGQLSLLETDYAPIADVQAQNIKDLLRDWWDITDRKTALDILDWLANRGHSGEQYQYFYEVIISYPDLLPEEILEKGLNDAETKLNKQVEISQKEKNEQVKALRYVKVYQEKTGDNLIYAWDWGRFVFVTQSAYSAGYITKTEALTLIEEVGKRVKKRFHSWEEFGDNYVIGRLWWTSKLVGTDEVSYGAYTKLMSPQGYWNSTPWEWSETEQ